MPEILLHYIWEHCLWAGFEQQTTDGRHVEILSVGEHNRDAGPDYSHARIRIDGREWVGNIEIHVCSSDWLRHKHHLDKRMTLSSCMWCALPTNPSITPAEN